MTYTTVDAIRQMNRMDDLDAYPDVEVEQAIRFAKHRIDRFTGTSFGNITTPTYDRFEAEVSAEAGAVRVCDAASRRVLFIRTVDRLVDAAGDDIEFDPVAIGGDKRIGVLDLSDVALWRNIAGVGGTAGRMDTPDEPIEWAARTLARNHLINDNNSIPDRALEQAGEFGPIRLAQPGVKYPTGLPAVDAVLESYRYRRSPVY